MAEYDKILPPPQFCQDLSWDPIHNRAPPKGIFDQAFGVPHLPDPGDRVVGSSSWPGYARSRLFTTSAQAFMQPSLWLLKQMSNELSVVRSERGRWAVSLDVNQFAPEEITIKVKEDCLEITGKHDERQEEHGFVSRCFVRKYKLPANVDVEHMTSYLSGDGVLSVEAPLPVPEEVVPEKTVIPIQERGRE
uniref:SHSP domain-containing protein n=1 Tax=Scleropages formosus TaxID=113540 RepID=A0A8C9V6W5_SCLFO